MLGTVTRRARPGGEPTPLADVRIVAWGAGAGKFAARTSSDGTYRMRVPVGDYLVAPDLPDSRMRGFHATLSEIRDVRSCRVRDIWLE